MKIANKIISVLLVLCMVISLLPNMAINAAAASAASSDDKNVLSALGIDTNVKPSGFDGSSTENPYGGKTVTVSPVSELYVEKNEVSGRNRTLYGDGLTSGASVSDFYADTTKKSYTDTGAGTYDAYRTAAGNFTASGLSGQMVTVSANKAGGVYLYFADPKNNSTSGTPKTLLAADKIIGNKVRYANEDFAENPYQLQNYMQVATGDFTGCGTDQIAVYVPEQGNSRIEVYQLKSGDWMNSENWVLAWTYSLSEGDFVSNMVSLTAGDMTGDGIDDLGIIWGVYYGKDYKTTSRAVVLQGSKSGNFLQKYSTIELKYGSAQTEILRAAMTIGDADGDGKDELIVGGQLESDIDIGEINTRFLALYEYDSSTEAFAGTASSNMHLIEDKDKNGNYPSGEDGVYYSSPACVANLACVKQDGPGTQEYVYMDSVLYKQGGNGFSISKELDEDSSLGTSREYKYFAEYGAIAGDFNGDGKETIMSMQYFMPYTSYRVQKVYWWFFRVWTKTIATDYGGDGYLREIDTSKAKGSVVVHSFGVGSTLTYAFAAPDTDNDTTMLSYTGKHYLTYTDPTVLAVLASPPYFSDLAHLEGGDNYVGNSETNYGVISGSSGSSTKSSTISLGAYVSFEHEFSVFGVKVGSIEAETEFSHGWTTETEITSTITQTVEYGTMGGQDTVALYSIPMDVYVYDAYVPKGDGTYEKQTMTVNLPYNAVIKTLALSDYDAIAADYDELPKIGGEILTHTVGDPGSYPKSAAGLKNVNIPTGDYMGVAFTSGGYIKQSLELDSEKSVGTSQTNSISVKVGGGVGDVKVGVTSGYEAGAGSVTTTLDGKSFSGTVVNMPAEAQGYGYNYSWKIMEYTYEGKQSFPVVTYLVADVNSPAKLPANFDMDVAKTTDTSITLTWDSHDPSIAGFQIYRHYDFPDGSGDYPVGNVVEAQGHTTNYSYTDDNLNPYTQYGYRIQAIRGSTPYLSVLGDTLTARTKAPDGQPAISLSTDALTVYPDKDASVTATVENKAEHVQSPLYQWQKKIDGVWTDVAGKTTETLTFSLSGSAEAGEYRCRVNQMVGEYAISAYSDTVPVTFLKRTAIMDITVEKDSTGLKPKLVAKLTNSSTDSGSIPTGIVTFDVIGTNYARSYTAAVEDGSAVCTNLAELAAGVYEITAYYSGSRIFKSVTSKGVQYLAGIDKGYWLEMDDRVVYGESLKPLVRKFEGTGAEVTATPVTGVTDDNITLDYTAYKAVSYNENETAVKNYLHDFYLSTYFSMYSYCKSNPDSTIWIPTSYLPASIVNGDVITPTEVGSYKLEVAVKENDVAAGTLKDEFTVARRPISITAPTDKKSVADVAQPNSSSLIIPAGALKFSDSVTTLGLGVQCVDTGGTVRQLKANDTLPGLYTTKVTTSANAAIVKAQNNYKFTFVDGLYTVTGTTYAVVGKAEELIGSTVGEVHVLSPENHVEWSTKYQAGTGIVFTASPSKGYSVSGWKINGTSVDMSKLKNPNMLTYTMLADALNVSVRFKVAENTLTFSAVHGKVECSSGVLQSGATVIEDAQFTFKAIPDKGYHFKEWWLDANGTSYPKGDIGADGNHTYALTMPSTSCRLYAMFERDGYELTLGDHMTASYMADTDNNTQTADTEVIVKSGDKIPGDTNVTVAPMPGYQVASKTNKDPGTGVETTRYLWSTVPEQTKGVIAADGQSYIFTIVEPAKVTAELELQKYTVKWDENLAGSEENTITITANGREVILKKGESHEFDGGTAIVITAVPAYGVVFDKWKAVTGNTAVYSTSGNVLTCTALAGNLNVTAVFKANDSYDVTLKHSLHGSMTATLNGKNADISSGKLHVFKGDDVVLTALANDGYMVGTWKAGNTVTQTTAKQWKLSDISTNLSVELNFTAMVYYTVTFNAGANGSLTAQKDESVTLNSGDKPGGGSKITFTANPQKDYMVDKWTVNGETLKTKLGTTYVNQDYVIDSLSKDTKVTVSFKTISTHTVTITDPTNGTITSEYTPDDFGPDVRDGAAAVFTVKPDDGYEVKSVNISRSKVKDSGSIVKFDSIIKNKDGTWTCTVNSTEDDITVSADIAKLYTITLYGVTGGIVTVSAVSAIAGKSITITAAASNSYQFRGWSASTETEGIPFVLTDPSAASTTFIMPESNVSITPGFDKLYTITLHSVTGGTATVSAVSTIAGKLITITAVSTGRYRFRGWAAAAETQGTAFALADSSAASTTFIMPKSNVSITPKFSYSGGGSGGGGGGSKGSTVITPVRQTSISSPTGAIADISGAAFPSGVSSVSFGASILPPTGSEFDGFRQLLGANPSIGAIGDPVLYDLQLLDQRSHLITGFTGKVKVQLPVPTGRAGNLHVFRYDNTTGTYEDMGATLANGFLTFETLHFSYYAIVQLGSTLTLDTVKNYTLNRGGKYSFLVKKPTVGVTYTASATDGSILGVTLTNAKDKRGWLFTITGLKAGTTAVNVLGSNHATASFPVTVTGAAGSLTLDTVSYTLAPKSTYEIGSQLTGVTAQTLKVYSSNSKVAIVTKLKNGNYRVTGVTAGISYIMYDVYDKNGGKLAHASTQVTVQKGAKAHGSSMSQTTLF